MKTNYKDFKEVFGKVEKNLDNIDFFLFYVKLTKIICYNDKFFFISNEYIYTLTFIYRNQFRSPFQNSFWTK